MLTVNTPAETIDLLDLATVKVAMKIADGSDDALLSALITRASDVIARHCNRVFALETVTETIRLKHYIGDLILSRFPVVEVTEIVEGGTVLTVGDYEVNKDTGVVTRLHNDSASWWRSGKIDVTYSSGFDVPDATPQALKQAALQLVKTYYHGADRDPMIRSESVIDIWSGSFFANGEHLPPEVKGLLFQFKSVKAR